MAALSAAIAVLLLLSSAAAAGATPGDRIITIVNMCNQTIRVGRTGGECNASNFIRYNVTGCPEGQTRNPANSQCYWDIPAPEDGKSLDLNHSAMITLRLTAPEQSCFDPQTRTFVTVKWSGNLWGATGCDVGERVCETAICFDGANTTNNGHCPTYQGPVGPVTRAEFTLQNEQVDTYDVTIIGGVNLPVEMKATITNITKSAEEAGKMDVAAYYWCGNPGSVMASNRNLSDCTWDFALFNVSGFGDQSTNLTLVAKNSSGNANCNQDADCADGEVCGTLEQLNDISGGPEPNLFPGKCGKLIGLWNANGVCQWAAGVSCPRTFPNTDPFKCMRYTDQMDVCDTFAHLYGCAGSYGASGYNVDSPTVCGCPTWEDKGINAPPVEMCRGNNIVWEENALPWVEWLKRACPTVYVFPFDDKSSTFNCQNEDPTFNNRSTQGYTITFCPGGKEIDRITQDLETSSSRNDVDFSVSILLVTLAALLSVMSN